VQEKLNAYKKFFKPLKGEFIYKRDGSSQEIVATARYYTEEDIKKDAEDTVARMNKLDKEKHWSLVSWRVVSKSTFEEAEENKSNESD
jgi:hypothetical protein